MKKILIFIISILFFYSFAFAENDINKLSKEDREQCEKMINLFTIYSQSKANRLKLEKQGYDFEEIIYIDKITPNSYITEKGKFSIGIKYEFDFKYIEMQSDIKIIRKDNKIIGNTPIFHTDVSGHWSDYYEYQEGYLFDVRSYVGKKYASRFNRFVDNPKNLKYSVILPKNFNKHQLNLRINKFKQPYIKIKNCFVEKYRN